ncbi:GNAT family N-acetyltransferase [Aeromonas hydrophila]|uniref:GNAT family N-acetyltransferase n=1 Tax=Aeromonas hydrophila TaxID=644 RepID=A0A926FLR3_AERHY|nr:GNAT family N-acetyltransferase [Aeromonas hydrophila]
MFSWQLDDELALLFLQPDMASELFALCRENRDYLTQWLPWPPYSATRRQRHLHPPRHRSLPAARADHRHRYQGKWSASSVTTRSTGRWPGQHRLLAGRALAGQRHHHRACQALIHHAFEEMGMEKVEISAATDNEPSRAVCERLGMQQEGITRRAERLADRIVDHVHYSLLRDEWLRQRDH